MKDFVLKNPVALVCTILSIVWIALGVSTYQFWEAGGGPMAGFFPVLVASVLLLVSVITLLQKEGKKIAKYHKDSFILIAAMALVLIGCQIIGAVPSLLLFLLLWLKVFEKASWKTTIKIVVSMAILIYGVFIAWLGINFPVGYIFTMLGF